MCDVTTAVTAMALLGGAETFFSIDATNKQAAMEMEAANNAYNADMNALNAKNQQILDAEGADEMQRYLQGMRERAKLRVSAGEAGLDISSGTPIRQYFNSLLQESYDVGVFRKNADNAIIQTQREKEASHAAAMSRYDSADSRITNSLMAGLQIGMGAATGGMSGYMLGSSFKGSGGSSKTTGKTTTPKGRYY